MAAGLSTLGAFLLALAPSAGHADSWALVKDDDGIKVYLRTEPGSAYKTYRGVVTIEADVNTLRALQDDVQVACSWVHECKEQSLLKAKGDQAWVYTRFNTPWPVTPRDLVVQVTSEEDADGSLTRTLQGVPDYVPSEAGYIRVVDVKGFWLFEPRGRGETRVTYQVHTEPGGSVPSWLANSFVVEAPFKTLDALRARAEAH